MNFIEYIKAIFIGIIEGITEWLPVSSTGHMILFDEFLKLDVTEDFKEMFLVVIQLGAILAVPILFWNKLWPFTKEKSQTEKSRTLSLWLKVIVGVIPAAVMGVLLDDAIDAYLYNPIVVSVVVSISLIVYGVGFILVEYFNKNKAANERYYKLVDIITKIVIIAVLLYLIIPF